METVKRRKRAKVVRIGKRAEPSKNCRVVRGEPVTVAFALDELFEILVREARRTIGIPHSAAVKHTFRMREDLPASLPPGAVVAVVELESLPNVIRFPIERRSGRVPR